jgi:hypothetical protein
MLEQLLQAEFKLSKIIFMDLNLNRCCRWHVERVDVDCIISWHQGVTSRRKVEALTIGGHKWPGPRSGIMMGGVICRRSGKFSQLRIYLF